MNPTPGDCRDYRALNATTIPDRYPLPHIQNFTAGLHCKNIFSKIDLVKAYYQIPVAKKRHIQNSYSIWSLRISHYAFWFAKCCSNFPASDEHHPVWT